MTVSNTEFYNTPDGDVMIKPIGQTARVLIESDRDFITSMLTIIRDRYPEAHDALMNLYSPREMNRWHYEYSVVHRFIRCNFGEYDQFHPDVDHNGTFRFEEVHCPLRGECHLEGIVCKPTLCTKITDREMEVFRLIARNLQTADIASELCLSPCTITRHRENIKAKIGAHSVAEMITYWHTNQLK